MSACVWLVYLSMGFPHCGQSPQLYRFFAFPREEWSLKVIFAGKFEDLLGAMLCHLFHDSFHRSREYSYFESNDIDTNITPGFIQDVSSPHPARSRMGMGSQKRETRVGDWSRYGKLC